MYLYYFIFFLQKPLTQDSQEHQATADVNTVLRKKKKAPPESSTEELVGLATVYFKNPLDTEADIVGKGWAIKLNRLAPDQRRYAEKIINDTLFEAEMGALTRHGVRYLTSSETPSRSSSRSPAASSSPCPTPEHPFQNVSHSTFPPYCSQIQQQSYPDRALTRYGVHFSSSMETPSGSRSRSPAPSSSPSRTPEYCSQTQQNYFSQQQIRPVITQPPASNAASVYPTDPDENIEAQTASSYFNSFTSL